MSPLTPRPQEIRHRTRDREARGPRARIGPRCGLGSPDAGLGFKRGATRPAPR